MDGDKSFDPLEGLEVHSIAQNITFAASLNLLSGTTPFTESSIRVAACVDTSSGSLWLTSCRWPGSIRAMEQEEADKGTEASCEEGKVGSGQPEERAGRHERA